MMPFLCSTGGGLHDSLIDVDDGEEPLRLAGDAEGPVLRRIAVLYQLPVVNVSTY